MELQPGYLGIELIVMMICTDWGGQEHWDAEQPCSENGYWNRQGTGPAIY
jgi:hypothetical protein